MTGDAFSGNHNASLTLTIRLTSSSRFDVGSCGSISPSSTIQHVKELISEREESEHCAVERQRLIHKGRILSDNTRTLADYGIGTPPGESIVLYLVKSNSGTINASTGNSGAATASTSTAPNPAPVQPTNSNPPNPPANPFANFGNDTNPMANLLSGAGGGTPDLATFQQQLQQNPEMMQDMMNNPMVQSLMSNPDFLSSMFENNPQMRALMESNPELRNALQDPEFMRRQMEVMRDPSAMQNMMRNQDLAMSQIENMPGGFNALRSMYENVQEPMMDAMTGGDTNTDNSSGNNTTNSSNSGAGATNQAMPNPWGSPASMAQPSNPSASGGTASNPFAAMMGSMNNMNMNSPGGTGGANPWAAMGNPATQPNTQNIEATLQMLDNPMMQQMMQQFTSDPAAMQMMMNSNPQLQQLRQTNPQAAAIFNNPEALQQMMNPNNLRSMLQMQQTMQQLPGSGGMFGAMPGVLPPPSLTGASAVQPPSGGLDFSSLLGGNAGGASAGGIPAANRIMFPFMPPAGSTAGGSAAPGQPQPGQRFRVQLQNLQDMGFTDRSANIRALTSSHGNVNRAIEILLESPPEMSGDSNEGESAPGETGAEQAGETPAEGSGEGEEPKKDAEKKND